jgi:hypothetical protein
LIVFLVLLCITQPFFGYGKHFVIYTSLVCHRHVDGERLGSLNMVSFHVILKVLEGRSYRLQHPWVGIVNRSQADINKNVDMIAARQREREFFATSPDYGHLTSKMGSEYLAKLLSKVLFILLIFICNVMTSFLLLFFLNL